MTKAENILEKVRQKMLELAQKEKMCYTDIRFIPYGNTLKKYAKKERKKGSTRQNVWRGSICVLRAYPNVKKSHYLKYMK